MFSDSWKRNLLTRVGLIVEAKAKELVPKDTGRLMGSLRVTKVDVSKMIVTVGTGVEYGKYMERGRRPGKVPFKPIERWAKRHGLPPWAVYMSIKKKGIKAGTARNPFKTPSGYRPFLTSALQQSLPRIKNFIHKEVRQEIARYKK